MKKIKSEVSVSNQMFKAKIGTIDKKNPETVYIEIGTYISPSEEKKSYKDDVCKIESRIKKSIKELLDGNDSFYNEHIFVSEVPFDRMSKGKKSYFEMQLFVKPILAGIKNRHFSNIHETVDKKIVCNLFDVLKESIQLGGFDISKSKKC